jgi:hypothetical protein
MRVSEVPASKSLNLPSAVGFGVLASFIVYLLIGKFFESYSSPPGPWRGMRYALGAS